MPTRSALIPADVPSDFQAVFPDLVTSQKYLLEKHQPIRPGPEVLGG